ncbi:AT-rich interactive domain-containing protein 2 isoform X2 [Drosophila albomicans]|uniref:AT-rich interactive domain-containing protein 2 isoform X2 n=1 Tax=Drosophila albomicans TaxID=7291 RepID=A0A6P8XGS1_DROAB|nr:AT-rich interactive domain-containing protein 2 isoform X2 [Drosophila albomicans]
MTSIDSVRVLLQSLPAAAPSVSNNNNALQNELTPAKLGAAATPLRARNAQQQQYQQYAPQQLFYGNTPEKSAPGANGQGQGAPEEFWRDLHQFHERRGTPLTQAAKISGQHVDLYRLYQEVTERGGFNKVNMRDEWDEVYSALDTLRERCVNGTAGIKHIYRRYLDKYERLNFHGEDPDKLEALEAAIECAELGASARARSRALASGGGVGSGLGLSGGGLGSMFGNAHSTLTAVPMAYNQRQHIVNADRRRQYKMSTQLHKHSSYEKLLLSLISPLPNEQDFAINVCTLMANEPRPTLQLSECPKLLDVLLAHLGVYADYTMRQLFQHGHNTAGVQVRRHSKLNFWRDLLYDKPQILDLYTDEQAWLDNGLISKDVDAVGNLEQLSDEFDFELDFLNLRRSHGTDERIGQRVLQIVQLLRSLSFHQENVTLLSANRTLWRYLVMGANVRWSNIHIQALETAGNLAQQFELLDPATDELSRNLLSTLCEGIESNDRAVIISCLEILYKLCGREGNAQHISRCLGLDFYQRVMLLLSLTDVMLLIFTLEAIYALSALGARPCSMLMQVRGLLDQLVALLTVEAQSYGAAGCILMRVVEVVPGNMLPTMTQPMPSNQLTQMMTVKQPHPQPQPAPIVAALPPPAPTQVQVLPPQAEAVSVPVSIVPAPNPAPPALPVPSLPQVQLPMPSLPQVQLPPAVLQAAAAAAATATSSQAATATILPAAPSAPQSFTHEDETYALAWLGATYERAGNGHEHRVEQQELYTIYLSHCQKAGKHSVVNRVQFPRLVRLIFNPTVGPAIVRQVDGTDLPGTHYIGIRMRAQPLPMQQHKAAPAVVATAPATVATVVAAKKDAAGKVEPAAGEAQEEASTAAVATPSSSLIKSLLANKVNERQLKQKAQSQPQPPALVATTSSATGSPAGQPIKVTSTAISAFVNNPLMQHTPVKVGQTTIKPLHPQLALEKKPMTDSAPPPLAPLSGANVLTKDSQGRTLIIQSKRKLTIDEEQNKRLALDSSSVVGVAAGKEEPQVTPSKNAANLYADLAASILEDEDLDDVPPLAASTQEQQPTQQQQQLQLIPAKVQPAQRQLIFPAGNATAAPPQLKLATTATIKTDQGLQTVPVILQQKSEQQQQQQPTQTQYVLATNQQGQTYLVAQQTAPVAVAPPTAPATPTLLVTQTQPQHNQQTKTIIILQQPQGVSASNVPGTQKVIMTTAQGQQVLVTTTTAPAGAQPRPQTPSVQQQQQQQQQPQQIFINPQRGVPAALGAGQMSPSLLSQLNQIPATIKLHQPQPAAQQQQQQQQQLQRSSIVATKASPIPQLQQHQSIIQQHIISSPAATTAAAAAAAVDKRQILLGGIKETTLITQTPVTSAPLQQSQLNSQTIITTQPPIVAGALQQQQQHIRNVLEQQQQHHPSIIQQKISMPTTLSDAGKPKTTPALPIAKKQLPLAASPAPSLKPPQQPQQQQLPGATNESAIKPIESKPAEQVVSVGSVVAVPAATSVTSVIAQPNPTANPQPATAVPVAPVPAVPVDANWLFICDWRNCPRRKFKSLNELQHHVCNVHCPDHLDAGAEIYCQWGSGPSLCDNIARKRYSLMTHLVDRHLALDDLRASVQRRLATGIHNVAPAQPTVTIVRNAGNAAAAATPAGSAAAPATAATATAVGTSALQAIKRHSADFLNSKELMDENEGPVTKSIRLTAALILRNLVNNTSTAKRSLKRYEPHLANVAFSNVEASGVLSHILHELSQ